MPIRDCSKVLLLCGSDYDEVGANPDPLPQTLRDAHCTPLPRPWRKCGRKTHEIAIYGIELTHAVKYGKAK